MALPWLESVGAAAERVAAVAGGVLGESAAGAAPVRLAFVFMPNGVNYDAWKPAAGATETEVTLSPTLE